MADFLDVVVVGGSTGAVSAAASAAAEGRTVFLVADRTYLGEYLCAHQRLWLAPDEEASSELARRLFPEKGPARPLHVKRTLDRALEDAGVRFLFCSFVTDFLRDAEGRPAGVVIANRTGLQAIPAKTIVDGFAADRTVESDVIELRTDRATRHFVGFSGVGVFGMVPYYTENRFIKQYKGLLGLLGDRGPFLPFGRNPAFGPASGQKQQDKNEENVPGRSHGWKFIHQIIAAVRYVSLECASVHLPVWVVHGDL